MKVWVPIRNFSSKSQVPLIFNRRIKQIQRDRAAFDPHSRDVDYLKDEIANRMVDRLLDIKRTFSNVLDLGCGAGHVAKFVDKGIIPSICMSDFSDALINRDIKNEYPIPVTRKVIDEENINLPQNSYDCILSNLSLHWTNDLLGSLIQIHNTLKPDGVFLGAMFGGETLYELRTALQLAQTEREGGISPHVSPMADIRDMASLLQRAGFTLTTVDQDEIIINFPSMFELMSDLRSMGENNAVASRKPYLHKDTLLAASAIYDEMYGDKDSKSVTATFQVIYMIGWKPDAAQPKPLERGSAKDSLKNLLS